MTQATLDPNFILLYVTDPAASAAFYAELLGHGPLEASPTFCMFALNSSTMLGLWARHTVSPAANGEPGTGELAFSAPSAQAVTNTCAEWQARGLVIAQEPIAMDFGFTFLALDPDGHRLRVFAPMA